MNKNVELLISLDEDDSSQEEESLSDSESSDNRSKSKFLSLEGTSSKYGMTLFSTSHKKLLKGFSISSMSKKRKSKSMSKEGLP